MDIQKLSMFDEKVQDNIATNLREKGYIIIRQSLNLCILKDLQKRAQSLASEYWDEAGIGRNDNYQQNKNIRSDKIFWLTTSNIIESNFLACMEKMRQNLNRRLFLGLFDYESHFAIYPKGTYYAKHLDVLKGDKNRVLSTIFYLNSNWQERDAGELLLYSQQEKLIQRILPELGTFVLFLSENFPHEVIKANRQRYSLTGWFRVKSSHLNLA